MKWYVQMKPTRTYPDSHTITSSGLHPSRRLVALNSTGTSVSTSKASEKDSELVRTRP